MTSVIIPNGVTEIGVDAFSQCSSLISIEIPNSVISIGSTAFESCWKLSSVIIGSGVTSIGVEAFSTAKSIYSRNPNPTDISNLAFYYPNSKPTLYVPYGSKSAYQSKTGWSKFQNIVEMNMDRKRSVHVATAGTLPNLISDKDKYYIEDLTLTGDLNGTDIKFIRDMSGKGLTDSGKWYDEERFGHYETPGTLKILDLSNANIVSGGDCYDGTNPTPGSSRYADAYYTKNNSISGRMFSGCKLTSIKIPNSVTSIDGGLDCRGLASVTIGYSLTSIKGSDFSSCGDLTSIVVESGNVKYDSRENCNAIIETSSNTLIRGCKNTNIPNSVTSIGDYAFSGCSDLTSITIPNSVTSIGRASFSGCTNMADIYVLSTTPIELREDPFGNNLYQKTTLHVPSGCLNDYSTADYWKNFVHIVDDIEPSAFMSPTTTDEPMMIYDLNGRRLPHLIPGVNIIKYKNGEVKKRFIRMR